ncbi:MAG: Tyrosine-specific transport protein [Holosporales bacterium]
MAFCFFHRHSKEIGATFLVAGTTVGAGMLAMPLTAVGIGFLPSLYLLFGMWAFMFAAAYVQSRLFISQSNDISFVTLVERILGKRYKIIPATLMCLLFFGLLAAYITAGASVLAQILSLSKTHALILFSVVFGAIICAQLHKMDQINRVLVLLKFSCFGLVIYFLLQNIQPQHLEQSIESENIHNLLLTIPMFFTAFGFHGSIPTLVTYLEGDQKKLTRVFLIGSLIPLLTYVLWLMATFGGLQNLAKIQVCRADVGAFLSHLGDHTVNPLMTKNMIQAFSFLAFVTSFIGVGLGQMNYIQEVVRTVLPIRACFQRYLAGIITVGIPFLFALFYPDGFLMALTFAGIWLCILAVILPAIMALIKKESSPLMKIISVALLICGMLLFGLQLFIRG